MHLNLNQMIYTVFNGIIFALMLEATGSIVTPVSMHFLINSFPILLDFLMRDGSVSSASGMASDTISPIFLIVFGAISAPSLYLLYRIIRKTAMRNKRFIAPAKTVSFKGDFRSSARYRADHSSCCDAAEHELSLKIAVSMPPDLIVNL